MRFNIFSSGIGAVALLMSTEQPESMMANAMRLPADASVCSISDPSDFFTLAQADAYATAQAEAESGKQDLTRASLAKLKTALDMMQHKETLVPWGGQIPCDNTSEAYIAARNQYS